MKTIHSVSCGLLWKNLLSDFRVPLSERNTGRDSCNCFSNLFVKPLFHWWLPPSLALIGAQYCEVRRVHTQALYWFNGGFSAWFIPTQSDEKSWERLLAILQSGLNNNCDIFFSGTNHKHLVLFFVAHMGKMLSYSEGKGFSYWSWGTSLEETAKVFITVFVDINIWCKSKELWNTQHDPFVLLPIVYFVYLHIFKKVLYICIDCLRWNYLYNKLKHITLD